MIVICLQLNSLDGAGGFSEEDSQFIINFMKVAIQLAKPNFLGGEVSC